MVGTLLAAWRKVGLKNKIGYIARINTELNPGRDPFEFHEATFTRTINSRGDKIRSKLLCLPVDYSEIVETAQMMKRDPGLIIVREPFLLDDELHDRVMKWVEWANKADPKEYDFFA